MFDMGPYYITALTTIFGPVQRVTGSAQTSIKSRIIRNGPRKGELIDVQVPTHIAGILDFESGPVGTIITSFDTAGENTLPRIEIYGTEGTLTLPDPNFFGGPVLLNKSGENAWNEVPLEFGHAENSRGLGLADMAVAIQNHRPHRANDEVAYHTLDIMHALHDSSKSETHIQMQSKMTRPAPLLPFGILPT